MFHGNEDFAVLFANIVNSADVGVIQSRGSSGFALKTLQSFGVFRYVIGQKFQCDKTVQARVLGLVDHAHSARTEFFQHSVVRNRLTGPGT